MVIDYAIFILAIILFVVFCVLWSLHFISLIYGKYKFHKKPKCLIEKEKLPGVSIIKPLMGVDDNLLENLETFFNMNYPLYEILFCVQDVNDASIGVVKTLLDKYPNVNAKLFSGGKVVGINPKINNMIQGYEAARYELLLISDAGLRMNDDTLYDMVSLMTEKVGLVHQMPFTCDRSGFAGTLEKVYFGTCHARMYLFINLIGINCVTGMSCLMRKNVLDNLGGMSKFGCYIAEDFFIAKAYLDNNWVIQLAHQPVMQNSAAYSVASWQKRMIRWCKLRLKLNVASWLEPVQECFMLGLCTSWTVSILFGWNSLVFFLIHILGWFLCDYMLLKVCQNGKLPFTKFEYTISWLYRESICFYLFLKAAANPTVKWREGTYRLKWGTRAIKIEENVKPSSTPPSSPSPKTIQSTPITDQEANSINGNGSSKNMKNFEKLIVVPEMLSTSTTTNKTHKRTASQHIISNKSNNSLSANQQQIYSNSDLENSSTPFLSNQQQQQQQHPSQLKAPFNHYIRSHQQHHSISSPFSTYSFNQQSNSNLTQTQPNTTSSSDLTSSKFLD